MKSRTTVFLIVALMGCIAYVAIWRGGLFLSPDSDPLPQDSRTLLIEKPGIPVELTVTSQAGGRMTFRADGAGWRIVEPIQAAAIDDKIRALLDMLVSTACLQRYEPADPNAPAANVTGLESPRWTITLTDDRQRTCGLEIGGRVPLSGNARTYVRVAGDERICIAAGDLAATMAHPVSYYRRATVLEIPAESIMSVRVDGSEKYTVYRELQDKWVIKSEGEDKGQFPGDKLEIEAFLSRFARINAREFVDDNPTDLAPYGLADGERRLAVTVAYLPRNTTDAETRTIILGLKTGGAGGGKVFAKLTSRPTVFTLPAAMVGAFQPDMLRLRDKTVLPITAEKATRIELTLESESMTLAKTGGKWSITAPAAAGANQQRVQLILDRLASLKAVGFRHEKASEVQFGFDKPRGVIRVLESGSDKPLSLEIGADSPAGAVAFVRSSSADVVAAVGASEVRVFLASPASYYDATLWRLGGGSEVSRIALKHPDGAVELATAGGGKWRLTKPLDAPADAENVNAILDRLDDLTATRIVSTGEKTRAYYARGARRITATFAVRAGGAPTSRPADKTHTFDLAILDGKVYGWIAGDPLARVGLFTGTLYGQFAAEVRRRKVLDFDPESITGIALTSGGARMVLKKIEGGWRYPGDPNLQIDLAAVKSYLDRIKGLRAIQFVSHQAVPPDKFGLDKSRAWLVLELTTKDNKTIAISVSREGSDATANRYASATGTQGAFTISAEAAANMARKIGDFK